MTEKVACFLMSWITGDKGQVLVDFYITVFCLFSCIQRFIYLLFGPLRSIKTSKLRAQTKKLMCCSQSDVHSCSIFSFPEETPTGRVSLDGRLDPQGANKYLSAHFFLDIFLVLCRMRYQLPASHLSSVFVLQMNWAMKLIMPENAHSWI